MTSKLPYFHVWFDPNSGYGHIIENPKEWKDYFGQQVIANVLDIPTDLWRKPRRAMKEELNIESFKSAWKPFDWTDILYDK